MMFISAFYERTDLPNFLMDLSSSGPPTPRLFFSCWIYGFYFYQGIGFVIVLYTSSFYSVFLEV